MKTFNNTSFADVEKNVLDVRKVGNGDMFLVLCKASSEAEGWMKSTKAMAVRGGCVVQTSTQQMNPDGSYAVAEALVFVPNVEIIDDVDGGRRLA
jgi:hypothetical protein